MYSIYLHDVYAFLFRSTWFRSENSLNYPNTSIEPVNLVVLLSKNIKLIHNLDTDSSIIYR